MNILPNGEAFKPEGPQPLLRDLPPSQPFPEETLGPLLPAVRAVQSSTQAPLAIPCGLCVSVGIARSPRVCRC